MAVVDAADVEPTLLLPPLPQLIEPHTPLTAFSSLIAALHALSRRASTRSQLLAELTIASAQQSGDPLSALYPLLLHCFARLQPPTAAPQADELQAAQPLWTAVRNLLTQRHVQSAFIRSASFFNLLSCLASLCSFPAGLNNAALSVLGCQLLANAITDNADTQSVFLHSHLLSPQLLAIVRSCPRPCLSSLLYVLHTVLLSAAAQCVALESAGGAALLAEMTLRLSSHQQQRHTHQKADGGQDEEEAEDNDDVELDGGLLFPSLMHRLFVHHSSLLSLLFDYLHQQHPTLCCSVMAYLQSTLLTLSSCALETEHAAYCASANCLSVLAQLLARYPIEPSERLQDDEEQYAQLQRTLHVDDWTHACVLLVEHVLSSWLSQSPSSIPPLPLLQRLFAADVWYMLISLLASSNTPASYSSSSSSSPSASSSSDFASSSPRLAVPFGFQSDLLRLLSLLCCYPASQPPPYPRLTAVSFLGHTSIAPSQPMQREYSVVGIRGLCRWEEARQALASLEAQAVDGQSEWRKQGVHLSLDQQSRKVRMSRVAPRAEDEDEDGDAVFDAAQQPTTKPQHSARDMGDMWSIDRMAAVRSAGRRVDWGDAQDDAPFTDEDFM